MNYSLIDFGSGHQHNDVVQENNKPPLYTQDQEINEQYRSKEFSTPNQIFNQCFEERVEEVLEQFDTNNNTVSGIEKAMFIADHRELAPEQKISILKQIVQSQLQSAQFYEAELKKIIPNYSDSNIRAFSLLLKESDEVLLARFERLQVEYAESMANIHQYIRLAHKVLVGRLAGAIGGNAEDFPGVDSVLVALSLIHDRALPKLEKKVPYRALPSYADPIDYGAAFGSTEPEVVSSDYPRVAVVRLELHLQVKETSDSGVVLSFDDGDQRLAQRYALHEMTHLMTSGFKREPIVVGADGRAVVDEKQETEKRLKINSGFRTSWLREGQVGELKGFFKEGVFDYQFNKKTEEGVVIPDRINTDEGAVTFIETYISAGMNLVEAKKRNSSFLEGVHRESKNYHQYARAIITFIELTMEVHKLTEEQAVNKFLYRYGRSDLEGFWTDVTEIGYMDELIAIMND